MKKIIALTLSALMLVAALAGCGGTASADNGEFTVGICQLMVHESLDKATQGFIDALTADVEAAGKTGKMAASILLEGKSPADFEVMTLTPAVAYNEELCAQLGIAAN